MVIHIARFMSWCCPSGSYRVNIKDEIEKYRNRHPGRTPTIVFDSALILSIFLTNNDEIFSGGRMNLIKERIEMFFKKLKSMGTDLIFFDDGQVKDEKMTNWLTRVNQKYFDQCRIFEDLKNNKEIDMNYEIYTSFCLYEVFRRIAKKYGEVFLSFHNECDNDCAAYATKINAMSVITMDSDFLIMPGDWPIWVPYTIDLESYTITAWDKRALRETLNLKQSQMPIFSTLLGNDWIDPERVIRFKRKFGDTVLQVAKFTGNNFPYGVPLSRAEFLCLVDILYDDGYNCCTIEQATDMVDKSLEYHSYDHIIPETTPEWLENHAKDTFSNIVYSLQRDRPIFVQQQYIDLSMPDVRPYCDLALPIIRKQMGITDYHKSRSNIERIIYLKPSHEDPYQQQTTTPIFPDFEIPPLNILLGYDVTEEENANLADKRLEIFCWSISTGTHQVKPEVFKIVENKAYIPSILVLAYLVEELQISSDEADVMLLSIYETINSSYEKLETIRPPELYDPRGFWLAHVFLRLRQIFFDSFLLCGLNEYRQNDSYDGFIFHKMFTKYQLLDCETKRSLMKPIEPYRIYAQN